MLLKQTIDAVKVLHKCNKTGRKVYIRGTGNLAPFIFNELINLEIQVSGFVDIVEREKSEFLGLPILIMDDVYNQDKSDYFIVCSQLDIHVYFEIRDELEAHGLVERKDFYHFGSIGMSFLRQDEKAIVNAQYIVNDSSVEGMIQRNYATLCNYYESRLKPFLPNLKTDYLAEKVFFSKINLIPNLSCTLSCKYCCAGCQHSTHKTFEAKQIVDDFDKMLGVSKVQCAGILGGELFLHPQISEVFRLFSKMENIQNCECVEVFTNAMVIPSDDVLQAFNEIPLDKFFMISNYTGLNDKNKGFIDRLEKHGIKYEVFAPSDTHLWNHPGDIKARGFEKIDYTADELNQIRLKCWDFYGGWTILEGKLYICGYNVYALYPKLKDYVDIRNTPVDELQDKLFNYAYNTKSYDLCAYCRGTFYGCEKIRIAEQLR